MVASSNSGVALWQHTADSPQWLPVSLLEAAGFEQGESSKLRFSLIGVS